MGMELRLAQSADCDRLRGIDATIHSTSYLHVQRTGQGLSVGWTVEERPLRSPLTERNLLNDEADFAFRQVVRGAEEGIALVCEHQGQIVGAAVAVVAPEVQALRILDVRVDSDYRRQGLATALLYRCIQEAKERRLRAVMARTLTNNAPASHLLSRAGFELAGLDSHLFSNHDLVKEAVALFWYVPLD